VSKFQLLFEAMMRRCDFSVRSPTWVKQLDSAGRWRFLMQYDLAAMQALHSGRRPRPTRCCKRDSSAQSASTSSENLLAMTD
jgi:hypothetical protein